ncbi:DNA-binding protein [Candidatus Anstonella stagnisolia]|nr:DNA-binding protein [Candidatus Anstonella stagnisolia]
MEEDEGENLQEARQKRLRQMLAERQQAQQMDEQKKSLLMRVLENDAYERAMMVRISSPETYDRLISVLAQLYQSGQLKGKLNEAQLRAVLAKLTQRREGSITIQKK